MPPPDWERRGRLSEGSRSRETAGERMLRIVLLLVILAGMAAVFLLYRGPDRGLGAAAPEPHAAPDSIESMSSSDSPQ